MSYKWRPSKSAAAEYGAKMREIEQFCADHNISASLSSDSYYFTLRGTTYRVSNHSIDASNRAAYDELTGEQRRALYHDADDERQLVCILAGKTRIIDIYNDLAAGYELDIRGRRKSGK